VHGVNLLRESIELLTGSAAFDAENVAACVDTTVRRSKRACAACVVFHNGFETLCSFRAALLRFRCGLARDESAQRLADQHE
jgi:hypothetical protein